jgi:murein DD-endopeptidase MepM/ murein hydrolase activator NlpD
MFFNDFSYEGLHRGLTGLPPDEMHKVGRLGRWSRGSTLAVVIVLTGIGGLRASWHQGHPLIKARRGSASEVASEAKAVIVLQKWEGGVTHFLVRNKELSEITMTFEMGLRNLKGNVAFPYTATFPPSQTVEAFTLTPIKTDAKWEYSYTNFYKLGSNCARHDDSCVYQLPYAPGDKYKVTQGYNGKFSHKGSNQYAIDWEMPEGTLVHAARGGLVVRVKDDSNKGGPSMEFDPYNNYVLIRHEDGTLGHYCHLQKGGCMVKVGQTVNPGDVIAHSGNTGFSSGPHLHFCVFKTKNGRERISIPVRFRTAKDTAITLVGGRSYRAAQIQSASARSNNAGAL